MHGKMNIVCEKDGKRWEPIPDKRGLVSVLPRVYCEETNIGDEDALMCVMLGMPQPVRPTYPPGSPAASSRRDAIK